MSETHYLATHPVARALELFGDRWTILIMRDVFLGNSRFSALQNSTGASKGTLSSRLGKLVAEGVLRKESTNTTGKHLGYQLTDKGRATYSWALMLWQWEWHWADKFSPAGGISGASTATTSRSSLPSTLTHCHPTKHPLTPTAICRHCQQVINYDAIKRVVTDDDVLPGAPPAFLGGQRRTRTRDHNPQSLGHIAEIIGDRWTLLVLGCAFMGLTRFDDVMHQLGIASNILSDRLRLLVNFDLLAKVTREEGRHHDYQLTEKGKSLYPQTMVLRQWALEWLPAVKHPVTLVHGPCGKPLETDVVCTGCHAIPKAQDVQFR